MTDPKAGQAWSKIVDGLYNHRFAKARQRLGDFEKRWGESRETRNLRAQLERLPADALADD